MNKDIIKDLDLEFLFLKIIVDNWEFFIIMDNVL